MSDKENLDLQELFSKKLNKLTAIITSTLAIFIVLFVAFMIKSSTKDGVQDTQITQLIESIDKTNDQVNKIADATNLLITEKEVKQTEYNNLLELLNSTNDMAKKTEWAVLTGDKSIITRDTKIKK